jgi:hypothetical protein
VQLTVRRVAELGLALSRPAWIQSAFDRAGRFAQKFVDEMRNKPALTLRLAEAATAIAEAARTRRIVIGLDPFR